MFKTVNEEVKLKRLEICNTCEFFNEFYIICKKCGCYMPAKAMFANSACPVNKWSESSPGTGLINQIEESILKSWNNV